jgi:hypothetical protein
MNFSISRFESEETLLLDDYFHTASKIHHHDDEDVLKGFCRFIDFKSHEPNVAVVYTTMRPLAKINCAKSILYLKSHIDRLYSSLSRKVSLFSNNTFSTESIDRMIREGLLQIIAEIPKDAIEQLKVMLVVYLLADDMSASTSCCVCPSMAIHIKPVPSRLISHRLRLIHDDKDYSPIVVRLVDISNGDASRLQNPTIKDACWIKARKNLSNNLCSFRIARNF